MSRTHGNEKSSSQFTTSVKPIASFLQTRDFAPLQTDLDEDAPLRSSGYSENFLEKIINQRSTESSNTPVQAKPMNRLKTLQAQRMGIQAKLNIGEPNDKYEREADHTAVQVVQQINSSSQNQQSVQRDESMESEEKEEEELQMKPDISQIQRHESMEEESEDLQMKSLVQRKDNVGGGEASSDLESSIEGARGGGQSLDASLQEKMGVAMGADFSGVKVHTDSQSDQLNKSIQAKAFTTGQDLFFRQGAYEPSSRGGQELIAHELTHVVQQNGNVVQRKPTTTPLARSTAKPKADIQMTMGSQQQKQQMAERVAKSRTLPSVKDVSSAPAEPSSGVSQGVENSSPAPAEPHTDDSVTSVTTEPHISAESSSGVPQGAENDSPAPAVLGGGGGDKNIATLDPTVASKDNKDAVKYFLLKERSDDYMNENSDSSQHLFKLFKKTEIEFRNRPTEEVDKDLKGIGWNDKDIADFHADAKTSVEYLKTEESRTDYEIQGGSTLTQGNPAIAFDTSQMAASPFGKGHGIYVMSPSGQIYAHSHKVAKFHHSSFLEGLPTAAAGTMKVTQGKLDAISCKTGHYLAGKEQLYQVLMELKERGVSLSGVEAFNHAAKKYDGEEADAEGFLKANKDDVEEQISEKKEEQELQEKLMTLSGDPVAALKAKGLTYEDGIWKYENAEGASWTVCGSDLVKLLKNEITLNQLIEEHDDI